MSYDGGPCLVLALRTFFVTHFIVVTKHSFVSVCVDKINVFFSLSPLTSQGIYYQNNSPQSAWARLRWKSRLDGLSFIGFPHGIKHFILYSRYFNFTEHELNIC